MKPGKKETSKEKNDLKKQKNLIKLNMNKHET